jgi:ATP-binding cassette, subfamily G (WHITE), member 2, SNQ2
VKWDTLNRFEHSPISQNRFDVVSLYQASESLYDLFDKVLLIDKGKMVYFRSMEEAVPYFTDEVAFQHHPRQNATDFLASCMDQNARQRQEGYEGKIPTTTEELVKTWIESATRKRSLEALHEYKARLAEHPRCDAVEHSTKHEKVPKKKAGGTNFRISLWQQVILLSIRQYQLTWGDIPSLIAKLGGTIFQAIIVGPVFYNQQPITSSGFTWAGGK